MLNAAPPKSTPRGSYMIEQGICYLTLADKGYPKRLAFLYLEEIHQEFVAELRGDYGEEWRTKASSLYDSFCFLLFIAYFREEIAYVLW